MSRTELRTVTVYEASRDGRPLGFSLDHESLADEFKIRPTSRRATINAYDEEVGVVQGDLVDWNPEQLGNPRLKLHWICPQCGMQQWGDWSRLVSNPCLWGSDCDCVNKWLIHWTLPTSEFAP